VSVLCVLHRRAGASTVVVASCTTVWRPPTHGIAHARARTRSVYNAAPSVPFESAGGLVMPQHMGPVTRHVINPLAKAVLGDSSLHYSGMLRARDRLRERCRRAAGAVCVCVSARAPARASMVFVAWLRMCRCVCGTWRHHAPCPTCPHATPRAPHVTQGGPA
jgi:hypothetical protein